MFFDVKVFNLLAKSYKDKPLFSVFSQLERHKHRSYNQQLRKVEIGKFTPFIFSAVGGMEKTATVTYKRLATQQYTVIITCLCNSNLYII